MSYSPYNPSAYVPAPKAPEASVPSETFTLITELENCISELVSKDADFAKSLVQFYDQRKFVSDKQLYWVKELTRRGKEAKARRQAIPEAPAPEQLSIGNPSQLFETFTKALLSGLQFPKIRLQTPTGQKLILQILGSLSNYQGQIAVVHQNHGAKVYLGRIDHQGTFYPNPKAKFYPELIPTLSTFVGNLVEGAIQYGKITSHCCFCGIQLTTDESVAAGYGPICADKWGLPWGNK